MLTKRKPYRSLGNDLYCDLECTCPSPLFKGTSVEHLMKRKIKLTGYNDDYFFDVVNKDPQHRKCVCGRPYTVQWFRDGVEAAFDRGGDA